MQKGEGQTKLGVLAKPGEDVGENQSYESVFSREAWLSVLRALKGESMNGDQQVQGQG